MPGSIVPATCIAGKTVIETRCAASGAIVSNSMSGGALSDAAEKCVDSLLVHAMVRTTVSMVTWTCALEVVGAICSKIVTCHGSHVKPLMIMLVVLLVPCTLRAEAAYFQTVSSKWRAIRAALVLII